MLYLVATPIGNLGDITLRALETLKEVDYVVSEDTRKTGFLLKHFEIKKPQISFHEHNERKNLPRIMEILRGGQSVALVTDAGSPSISDPGYLLVRGVIEEDISFTCIPGPTAVISAVGFNPVCRFTVLLFAVSHRANPARVSGFFAVDGVSPHTLIFYESPYRLKAFLEDALEVLRRPPGRKWRMIPDQDV